jgi:hypothetical protein
VAEAVDKVVVGRVAAEVECSVEEEEAAEG